MGPPKPSPPLPDDTNPRNAVQQACAKPEPADSAAPSEERILFLLAAAWAVISSERGERETLLWTFSAMPMGAARVHSEIPRFARNDNPGGTANLRHAKKLGHTSKLGVTDFSGAL
jgi:hypothetical protein